MMQLQSLARAARIPAAVVLLFVPLIAWTQAAMTVPIAEGMGQVIRLDRSAASVFVGDPNVAAVQAVSDDTLFVSGVGPGVTNVFALDRDDELIASYEVVVTADTNEAGDLLGSAGPEIRSRGNTAVVVGTARDVDEALAALQARRVLQRDGRNVLDRTALGEAAQVSLRVRFVEASRTDLLRLGFDLSIRDPGEFRAVSASTITDDFLRSLEAEGGIRVGLSGTIDELGIDLVLNALEQRGIVEILSEPTLTTVSGRPAAFQAGGEFAFPVPQGDDVLAAEFRSFGVSLAFLPTVLPRNRIAIEVESEVSFIDDSLSTNVGAFQVPGLSTRRAETTVEVGSGQTFAIAGLYEQRRSETGAGAPGLRRAPLIGPLFDQRQRRSETRELVIFITPYLAEASNVATRAPARRQVVDTVGFILE